MGAISVLSQSWWSASEGGLWLVSVSVVTDAARPVLPSTGHPEYTVSAARAVNSSCECRCSACVSGVRAKGAPNKTDEHRAVDEKAFIAALTSLPLPVTSLAFVWKNRST